MAEMSGGQSAENDAPDAYAAPDGTVWLNRRKHESLGGVYDATPASMPLWFRPAPCPEAMALLDALWDLHWNGPGSADYGDHAGYTWAEDQALTDAAERVEDHYVVHGCRVIPPAKPAVEEAR